MLLGNNIMLFRNNILLQFTLIIGNPKYVKYLPLTLTHAIKWEKNKFARFRQFLNYKIKNFNLPRAFHRKTDIN